MLLCRRRRCLSLLMSYADALIRHCLRAFRFLLSFLDAFFDFFYDFLSFSIAIFADIADAMLLMPLLSLPRLFFAIFRRHFAARRHC